MADKKLITVFWDDGELVVHGVPDGYEVQSAVYDPHADVASQYVNTPLYGDPAWYYEIKACPKCGSTEIGDDDDLQAIARYGGCTNCERVYCPECGDDFFDAGERTSIEDHGVCWSCHRESLYKRGE